MSVNPLVDQQVRDIRDLLEHHYKEESFIREMIQNADDAGATKIRFELRLVGLKGATNPLLRGPLLLIANDGPLRETDAAALHFATGGNKAAEESKVGRFGLGLKSIFHWCESFVYCGRDQGGAAHVDVVNPYVREEGGVKFDPVNPTWQDIDGDKVVLEAELARLISPNLPAPAGLLLCAPLRIAAHLNRGTMRLTSKFEWRPELGQTLPIFDLDENGLAELVLVLAQCGSLDSVDAEWSGGSFRVSRDDAESVRRLSRPKLPAKGTLEREWREPLCSSITVQKGDQPVWSAQVYGIECLGAYGDHLRNDAKWPTDEVETPTRSGIYESRKRKAVPHAAITIVRWPALKVFQHRVAVRWAAFLPLDMEYGVKAGSRAAKSANSNVAWDVVLHGYYFPKPDRKDLEGLTVRSGDLVAQWNKGLATNLCLPLLPEAVLPLLQQHSASDAKHELEALGTALKDLIDGHVELAALTTKNILLPRVGSGTVRFEALELQDGRRSRPVREWARIAQIGWISNRLRDFAYDAGRILYDETLRVPQFAPSDTLSRWPADEVPALLAKLELPDKATADEVESLISCLAKTFSTRSALEGTLDPAVLCAWLHRLQALGWGPHGKRWDKDQEQQERVADTLLHWLKTYGIACVEVSKGARPAVERLAGEDKPGAVLVPSGKKADPPDHGLQACIGVLAEVADQIKATLEPKSKAAIGPKSWQFLARDLVAVVGLRMVLADPTLYDLPLIPVRGSAAPLVTAKDLSNRAKRGLVFRLENQLDEEEAQPSPKASDKYLIDGLATALNPDCSPWLTSVSLDNVLILDRERVAECVIRNASHLLPETTKRLDLLKELAKALEVASDPIKKAIRLLAHGSAQHKDRLDVLWIPPDFDRGRDLVAKVCLRLDKAGWRLVDRKVEDTLNRTQRTSLAIHVPDSTQLLQVLEQNCRSLNGGELSEEERLAILVLVVDVNNLDLFRKLPLHLVSGSQAPRCFVALEKGKTFRTGGVAIPPGLETGVTIIEMPTDPRLRQTYEDEKVLARFDEAALIEALLCSENPHQHAGLILQTLRQPNGHVVPLAGQFQGLARDLCRVAWLPIRDKSVAPGSIIDDTNLTPPVKAMLAQLQSSLPDTFELLSQLKSDALQCLPAELRNVIAELNHRCSAAAALARLISPKSQLLPTSWLTGPRGWSPTEKSISALLQQRKFGTVRSGWALLQAMLGADDGQPPQEALALVRAFQGLLAIEDWILILNGLTGQNDPALWEAWLGIAGRMTQAEIPLVLPRLHLRCRDDSWRVATEITACLSGVPESRQLHPDLARWLQVGEAGSPIEEPELGRSGHRLASAQDIKTFVEQCVGNTVNRTRLGAVFSLTGSAEMDLVAQQWLAGSSPAKIREQLCADRGDLFTGSVDVSFYLTGSGANERIVQGICRNFVAIPDANAALSLLEYPPRKRQGMRRVCDQPRAPLDIVFRSHDLRKLGQDQRDDLLRTTAQQFVEAILGPHPATNRAFTSWWKQFGKGSQAALLPVRKMLLGEMRVRLEELRVGKEPKLKSLDQRVKEIRRLELADDKNAVQRAQEGLATELARPTIASAVRELVRKHLSQEAYEQSSVLLELWQNADDALNQLAQVQGSDLPQRARRVRILLDQPDEVNTTLRFVHWGRLVNDDGGSGNSVGRGQEWDQDLYFMLRFRVSGKTGAGMEVDGVESTGYFGLGFKSVHFVSDCPIVKSGDIAFQIDAALLPNEVTGAALPRDEEEIDFLQPTMIDLPLRVDEEPQLLLKAVFQRIGPIAGLLPAMARQILTIELPQEYGGTIHYDPQPIDGATGWTLGKDPVRLADERPMQVLRYRTPPGSSDHSALRSLVLGIRDGLPCRLPEKVPTFWTVAPTQEAWGIGYALNDAFKLNTGRVHVEFGDASDTLLESLGEELGTALVDLANVVATTNVLAQLPLTDKVEFFTRLWEVIAGGLREQIPPDRKRVLVQLHGTGSRGLSLLAKTCQVVPTGLAAPWPTIVGPIPPRDTVHRASDAAKHPALCPLLEAIPELRQVGTVVAPEVAEVLTSILNVKVLDFRIVDSLARWSQKHHHEVAPVWLDWLVHLSNRDCWKTLQAEPSENSQALHNWTKSLKYRAADDSWQPSLGLLVPSASASLQCNLRDPPETFADELLRSAFAPRSSVLHPDYCSNVKRLETFLTLRDGLKADSSRLADWVRGAETEAQRTAAATYLAQGALSREVAAALRLELPQWLSTRQMWQTIARIAGLAADSVQMVEIQLFGPLSVTRPVDLEPAPQKGLERVDEEVARRRLLALWAKWSDNVYRTDRLRALRKELWPSDWEDEQIGAWLRGSLSDPSTRRAWMTLFLLAHVQGLGLGGRGGVQHRTFVELLQSNPSKNNARHPTWWDQLFGDGAPNGTWLGFLDEWSHTRTYSSQTYDYWMRVLPDMYAATKWWDTYAESLRCGHEVRHALAPATNPELSGDPDSGDVPAITGALRRADWIRAELEHFQVLSPRRASWAPNTSFAPSPRLTAVLERLGFFAEDDMENYRSEQVFQWLCRLIGEDKADFHGLGATPLEIDAADLLGC